MAEFDLGFSQKLIDAGNMILKEDPDSAEAHRTILYLSLLSCEITLKALLEKAGIQINIIKKQSHKLDQLLVELGRCKVPIEIGSTIKWVSASRIRRRVIDKRFGNATIGSLLEAEQKGASKYPNQIRYGDHPWHYPAPLMLKTAIGIMEWAKEHWDKIKK